MTELINAPLLAFPDFTKDFILESDASGIGLILAQGDEDGFIHPIACICQRNTLTAWKKLCCHSHN